MQLQEHDGNWRSKGTVGRKTVYSGGGSANRAVGRADSADKLLTPVRTIACLRN
ncbi:hypothetical protein [Actinomadura formosensis]|uniref:hypothetical protein n=1 Tax=Actinomadura formosensis TaxID=60706 RepID=UPI003D915FB2